MIAGPSCIPAEVLFISGLLQGPEQPNISEDLWREHLQWHNKWLQCGESELRPINSRILSTHLWAWFYDLKLAISIIRQERAVSRSMFLLMHQICFFCCCCCGTGASEEIWGSHCDLGASVLWRELPFWGPYIWEPQILVIKPGSFWFGCFPEILSGTNVVLKCVGCWTFCPWT